MHPQRRTKNRLLMGLGLVVVFGCIGAALFFGETSPVVAQGKVVLPETMTPQAQGMRTLFLIVRDAESPMPMPWGALVTTLSTDPSGLVYEFKLTKDNLRIMNPAADAPKKLIIKARLDLDGLGGADMPGDIIGTASDIPFGGKDIVINLTDLVTEGSPVAGP